MFDYSGMNCKFIAGYNEFVNSVFKIVCWFVLNVIEGQLCFILCLI